MKCSLKSSFSWVEPSSFCGAEGVQGEGVQGEGAQGEGAWGRAFELGCMTDPRGTHPRTLAMKDSVPLSFWAMTML